MVTKWINLGRIMILGARVYVHWSVVVIVSLLAFMSFKSPIHVAVSIASYVGVILLHELGHALMARHLGYDVDAIRVAFFHGLCVHEAPHTELHDVLISWAGVMAQLAVALPILTVAAVFDGHDFGYAAPAVVFLGYLSSLVALVNLAPSPGLDGYTAWRAVPLLARWWTARRATKRALRNLTKRSGPSRPSSSRRRR